MSNFEHNHPSSSRSELKPDLRNFLETHLLGTDADMLAMAVPDPGQAALTLVGNLSTQWHETRGTLGDTTARLLQDSGFEAGKNNRPISSEDENNTLSQAGISLEDFYQNSAIGPRCRREILRGMVLGAYPDGATHETAAYADLARAYGNAQVIEVENLTAILVDSNSATAQKIVQIQVPLQEGAKHLQLVVRFEGKKEMGFAAQIVDTRSIHSNV